MDQYLQDEKGTLFLRRGDQFVQIYPPMPPLPPVPTPGNAGREISRFWLALGFLAATFAAAFLHAPEWLTAVLATGTTSASAYYFGEKKQRQTP